jgi:type IV secretory pathway VirJ component
MLSRTAAAVMLVIGVAADAGVQRPGIQTIATPAFGTVTIYEPDAPPQHVVLFVSGDGGWNLGVVGMAERLRRAGALVAGIDIRPFMRTLESSKACAYPAGPLEELARAIQLRFKLAKYHRPILVGYSSGATLVYSAIAAAPPETFAGAISLGFCPDIELRTPLCAMRGLKAARRTTSVGYDLAAFKNSTVPWMVLQGEIDQVCSPSITRAFVAATGSARLFSLPKVGHGFGVPARWEPQFLDAYRTIATAMEVEESPRATAPGVADLSPIEVRASGSGNADAMVGLLTGDGGWADLDKHVAAGLSAHGIPVVAWSSLEYYWTPRTPAAAAADLGRIVDHYTTAWRRSRVFIVGYSFGADVAPFLVNRLPQSARAHIAGLALLGPSPTASFEFHVSEWLGGREDARYPTRPEVERTLLPVTCVRGSDELDSVCRTINSAHVRVAAVGNGHHFGGEYAQLVELIVRQVTMAAAVGRDVMVRQS